jgi:hypothetical protein
LFAVGLVFGGCTDRATGTSDPDVSRQVELCEDWCTLRPHCGEELLSDDEFDDCVDGCLDLHFVGRNEPCSVAGEHALSTCLAAKHATCDDLGDDPGCTAAQYPFSVCIADPDKWAAWSCDDQCLDRPEPGCCEEPD